MDDDAEKMLDYLGYMNRAGLVSAKADKESDLFFPGAEAAGKDAAK